MDNGKENMGAVILVVDDEPPVLRFIERILKADGHLVCPATNVQDCQRFVEMLGHEVDILIADFFLPDGNLLDILRFAKPLCNGLCVIVMSGALIDNQDFVLEGIEHLSLPKPFTREELQETVQKALNRSNSTDTPEKPAR